MSAPLESKLPSGWSLCPLEKLCSPRKDIVDPKDLNGSPYVGLEHIDSGAFALVRWGTSKDLRSAKTRFRVDDVLYGKLRPYLNKGVLAPWEGVCSTDILALKPREATTPGFLLALVHSHPFRQRAIETTAGTNLPRTGWKSLKSLELAIPPLPEQRAIAHILQTVQQAKEATDKVIAAARQLKQSMMRHLFTYGSVPVAQAERVEMRETEIGPVPRHWEVICLGEAVTQTQYGLSQRGLLHGKYRLLRMLNLTEGKIRADALQYVDLKEQEYHSFCLHRGDILFNRTNSYELVGKTSLFDLEGEYVFASYLIRVATDADKLNARFANYYMNLDTAQVRMRQLATRAIGQSNINATKLRSFLVPVPPLPEQKQIAAMLDQADAKIQQEVSRKKALDALFQCLLHHLMTGRVRVVSTNDNGD